jgi:hypothetical protein
VCECGTGLCECGPGLCVSVGQVCVSCRTRLYARMLCEKKSLCWCVEINMCAGVRV